MKRPLREGAAFCYPIDLRPFATRVHRVVTTSEFRCTVDLLGSVAESLENVLFGVGLRHRCAYPCACRLSSRSQVAPGRLEDYHARGRRPHLYCGPCHNGWRKFRLCRGEYLGIVRCLLCVLLPCFFMPSDTAATTTPHHISDRVSSDCPRICLGDHWRNGLGLHSCRRHSPANPCRSNRRGIDL